MAKVKVKPRVAAVEEIHTGRLTSLLAISLVLIFGGGLLAYLVQTAGGSVSIRDVRFMGTDRTLMSGLLYIPDGVTVENPAPGILAVHGYINSRETQDGFAIEFARRGYVVLALDQTGHGFSDPPAFANGFGGPDGLAYLRSLDFVDPDNIGLEGHSMGGWAVQVAAGAFPDGYKSMVIEGSSPGTFGAPEGTPDFPRNVAVVYSQYDEFSQLMWGIPVADTIEQSEKLMNLFGVDQPVVDGEVYGSIENGTARVLYQPPVVHPGDHISTQAIGHAIDWFQMTLDGGIDLPAGDQTWFWKEVGTLLAFIGAVLFLFPAGGLLLLTAGFRDLRDPLPLRRSAEGWVWWLGAIMTPVIPALTFFYFQNLGNAWFPANAFWAQNITTGIMVWAVLNALIALILFLVWHYTRGKSAGANAVTYGLTWPKGMQWDKIGKSFLLAAIVVFAAYILLAISQWLFEIDFRFWVVALKPMTPLHFRIFLSYLVPFLIYFLILGVILHGEMRRGDPDGGPISLSKAMWINAALTASGIALLLIVQYVPMFFGSSMLAVADEPLLTIVAYQFVPLLAIIALISTYFFRKTGHIYVGAFLNAFFVTWYIVAGQAIHFAF